MQPHHSFFGMRGIKKLLRNSAISKSLILDKYINNDNDHQEMLGSFLDHSLTHSNCVPQKMIL